MEIDEKQRSFFQAPASQKLVHIIERDAHELTNNWLKDVRQNSNLPTYRAYDEKELYHRAYRVYSQLGRWISHETTKDGSGSIGQRSASSAARKVSPFLKSSCPWR